MVSLFKCLSILAQLSAQHKKSVDLHFAATGTKADRAALWLSCGVCFEALACVLASAGANVLVMSNTFVTFLAIKTSQGSLILSILSLIPAPLCYLKAWK